MRQLVAIETIKPNPNNPRIIKDDKFQKLVNSIKEFPKMLEKRPIVVDENMIVLGGNMRLKAAKAAGLKEVWIDTTEDWTEDEKRQFIIKDNVSGGEWDWDALANEWDMAQLEAWGIDLPNYGELDDINLPDGDDPTLTQMTFTVHMDQKDIIDRALVAAKREITGTEINVNSNGNALFYLARGYVNE